MSWSDILEHEDVIEAFRRAVSRGRLASTFLFIGPAGIGKRTVAQKLAQALLCETTCEDSLELCGECPSCLQVQAGTHPDLEFVRRPPEKAFIPLELFIGDKEHRNREGLCHRIALKPMRGRRKIAVIDDADYLNVAGANCLLKTLEEPPPRSVIILIGTSTQRQLPTIRSRSQIVRFRPLGHESVEQLLLKNELVEAADEANALAALSEGSIQQALALSDPELREFRDAFMRMLPDVAGDSVEVAKAVMRFVEAAGKDAPLKRARLKLIAQWGMSYFRIAMRDGAADASGPLDCEQAADLAERCMDVVQHVDANANLTSVVEAWIDDLARRIDARLTAVAPVAARR